MPMLLSLGLCGITFSGADVGGFLGLGEKPVALPFDEVSLREGEEDMTDTLHATVAHSSEDLEGMKEWEG